MRVQSIRTKFLSGFMLIAGVFGGAVVFAWEDVSQVDQAVRSMFKGPVQAMDAGRSAQRDFDDLRRHYLAANTMPRAKWEQRYTLLHDKVTQDLNRVMAMSSSDEVRQRTERARVLLTQWDSALMRGDYMTRAKQIDGLADALQAEIDVDVDAAQQQAAGDIEKVGAEIRGGGLQIAGAGAGAFLFGVMVMLLLSRGVIRPIEKAAGLAGRIAAGQFNDHIDNPGRDETGQLLTALLSMRDSVHAHRAALEASNAELDKLAWTDKLTGLFNRRKADEIAKQQLASINRYGGKLSAILLDIDHFKQVNDTYGHNKGDEVISHIAAILRSNVRETDFAARWGGEEFVILLPNTPLDGAVHLAEKFRQAIAAHHFPDIGTKTSSFGVAQLADKETFIALMERADRALYRAKEKGRNAVETDVITAQQILPFPQRA